MDAPNENAADVMSAAIRDWKMQGVDLSLSNSNAHILAQFSQIGKRNF